jgi:hypothetical protein
MRIDQIKPLFLQRMLINLLSDVKMTWSAPFLGEISAKEDIPVKYGYQGDFLRLFAENKGATVHKWHHYIPLYDRYFSPYRGRAVSFLEIGVSQGGSLQMWRNYFGESATIFGIDVNPECSQYNGQAGQVRIGSQDDPVFLQSVVAEMGGIDIVLDDGSHRMNHILASLKCLFPHLRYGGIYFIEDLHTAYWFDHGGGYRTKKNFFRVLPHIIDDMHRWYHKKTSRHFDIGKDCSGIHIHDSIVVLDKNRVFQHVHSKHG